MAQRRMFNLAVTDTDVFLDMPVSTQALYFHLGMHGDDDGFVGSPKKIMRAAGCGNDDLKLLAAKGFVITFESGVVVLRDWRLNNTLKNDRYHETLYLDEKALIFVDDAGRYRLGAMLEPKANQHDSDVDPEQNIAKRNEEKNNQGRANKPLRKRFLPPSIEEVQAYCLERNNSVDPQRFLDYYETNGWVQGRGKPIRDWRACIRLWERLETERNTGNGQAPGQDLSWRAERSINPGDLIEDPPGSGHYRPQWEVQDDA